MFFYAFIVFLSAFLLFQIQPMIARYILAWFGGSAAVWTTCMLFFQVGLLLGYLYSHFLIERLPPRRQTALHGVLLAASLLLLPVLPGAHWKPTGLENPTLRILGLLTATVGLPYFLLSSTSPLLQAWYSRRFGGAMPYRLFALSNLGSMLALLTYPTLIEPQMAGRLQIWVWSAGYALFAVLCAFAAVRAARQPAARPAAASPEPAADTKPSFGRRLLWAGLAACGSMLMLAVANHLTQDVAAIPFLWVLPLSLYLLSFILTFDARGWYQRSLFMVLLAPALGGLSYLQSISGERTNMLRDIVLFAVCMFVACMVCHGELARLKPAPRYLTSFYLMLSIGGAAGGLFVAVVAPYLFPTYLELQVAIGLSALLAVLLAIEEPGIPYKTALASAGSIMLLLGVLSLWVYLGRTMRHALSGYVYVGRNFYGSLRIRDTNRDPWEIYRTLLHGNINHGEQMMHKDRRREHVAYYCESSGIGKVMLLRKPGVPSKVGVLGLGAGSMAAFGRPEDEFFFYEINPAVPRIARKYFSYLSDCKAKARVVMGDGRLSLEREEPQSFDVLMMDAFSGDSIPVHLVTSEALQLYFRHLKPDGILVVHISNKYLDLEPVLARLSRSLGKASLVIETEDDDSGTCYGTTYVLLANSPDVLDRAELRGAGHEAELRAGVGLWTDDYSNLYRLLK